MRIFQELARSIVADSEFDDLLDENEQSLMNDELFSAQTHMINLYKNDYPKVIDLLLNNGANPHETNDEGDTVFDYEMSDEMREILNKYATR